VEKHTFEMTLLFDFYGDLLTGKQQEYFDLYYNGDLSLSEIAEADGITRQGVRSVLKRGEDTLTDIEEKTGLVRRFGEQGRVVSDIEMLAEAIVTKTAETETRVLAAQIVQNLQSLKD